MNKNNYNKTTKAMRILALVSAALIAASMTIPLWVGK